MTDDGPRADIDETLALFEGLRDRDYRSRGLFVIEGRIVLEKAVAAGCAVAALLCVPGAEPGLRALADPRGIPLRALPAAEIERLAGFAFHRGVLGLAARPAARKVGEEPLPGGDLLALWQVSDPDNLGALVRTAAALGAAAVALGPGCADPYGRKALRASMGNSLSRPLYTMDSTTDLPRLGEGGRVVTAAALVPGARPLGSEPRGPVALVLGNEGYGLPDEAIAACDRAVVVPMAGDVDSLNVAAAGAILMYGLFGSGRRGGAI